MDYDIKKGWYKKVEGDALPALMKEIFGNCKEENGACVSSYGIMTKIIVKVVSKDKMDIVTETTKDASLLNDDSILDSKRRLNKFAEEATGFDAKARMKRAQKKAKEGKL